NMPAMVRLRGRLEVEVLRRALDEIFRRHEILRARFADERGEPRQIIEPAERLRIPIHDLSQLPAARRRSVADELALREARRTFDLAEGPLARISVLRLAAEEHLLLVVMHHLVTDGVSTGILIRELGPLYEAFAAGRPSPLAELEIQYADFTAWQSARLQGERLDKELAHWRACLAGAPEALELPFDRPRPPARSQRGMALRFPASAELGGRIRRFSQEQGTTQFIVLLACFEVLLHLSTGHRDLVVGTPVSGRSRREVAGLIGFFVNTLVLRLELGRDSTFRQLLERVKQVSAEAIAHQEVPFERLVETLQPERALSRSPLFQVMFGLEGSVGVDASRVSLGGLEARLIKLDRKAALVDLMLVIEGTESGFNTLWELDTDLFDAATVGRLNRRYLDLLDQLLRHPDRPLSRLEALVRGERQQVLYEWNDTAVTSRPSLLHQFFERQARQRPEAIAVICGEQRLTYGLIEARANQLAHLLSQQGLAAESRVAVLLPRTLDCVVALLSVLKAGCAYVPLDPAYPQERLTYMLEDSGAEIVLMGQDLATPSVETSAAKPVRALQLEGTRWALSSERRGPCATAARPGHLAYVIYTSGSTGRPKGVAIEHRSAAALIAWSHNVFSASELSGVLAATSLCFDLSIFELFVTLGRGGTVILANGALDLPRLPARDEVTLINTVPSAMAELVRTGGVPASVRTVNLAGEALRGALVASIYRLPQVERLLNLYGPSEDTTYSTGAVMGRQATHPAIGSPIAGTAAYVLDCAGSPVPLGVSGELYLGGAGLSRGYLGRAGLTAERFVPDGVSGSEGGRLYRTGDRVRHRPSGELDFQGRFDHQVKLRGFRIELGEIESVLESHTGVGSSVVRVDALGSSGGRLVAYWEDGEGPAPSAAALRSYLGARLPEYMVPAVLQRLEPLPRTPNGKVDRSALPAVSVQGSGAAVAPRTPYEEVLSQLWEELLGVECVGVEDDFFALGGHSLLATRMISRVRDDFGCELPVRHLFEHPTVAGLAREIEARQERGAIAGGTSIEPAPRTGRIPLSLAQRRLWLLQHLDGGFAYNMPVALRLRGELDWAALHTAVRHIAERHESLRTVFPARGGEPFQRILVAPAAVISVRDLSALAAAGRQAEADRWLRAEVRQPFDLESAPPWRLTLLRLDREEHLLVINLHHIISDGWSLSLFAGEMASCYEAAIEGRRPSLPQLPIQLADYAIWQQGWLAGDAREELLDFWRQRIAGAPQHLELPTDRPRPERPSFRGREQAIVLQAGLAGRLRTFSRERRATHFMTLLAAFQAVLSRTTGQRDLLIGSPIAGRQQS
ncbi:MAG: amino acid adenylation domain-containing protein, partial [Acidobacteriota bacterium]